jgi:hypothetical protein
MKCSKILLVTVIQLFLISSLAFAGDFDWIRDFNISAEADPSGFRARLETRFKIDNLEINAVLEDVAKPSDAYVLFRLGEMSNQPVDYIMKKYRAEKDKGWGVLAKSLGIKPGSSEFHALKRGQDLYDDKGHNNKKSSKGKGKGRK